MIIERQVRPPSTLWNSEISTEMMFFAYWLYCATRLLPRVAEHTSVSPTRIVLAAPAPAIWTALKRLPPFRCTSASMAATTSLSSTARVCGAICVRTVTKKNSAVNQMSIYRGLEKFIGQITQEATTLNIWLSVALEELCHILSWAALIFKLFRIDVLSCFKLPLLILTTNFYMLIVLIRINLHSR